MEVIEGAFKGNRGSGKEALAAISKTLNEEKDSEYDDVVVLLCSRESGEFRFFNNTNCAADTLLLVMTAQREVLSS